MENVRSLTRLPPAFQSALATSLLLLLVNAVAPVSVAIGAQPPPVVEEPGVSGYVLAPDGTPVSGGTVVAQSGIVSTRASIDSTGRFRLVPMRSGSHQFLVSVPGLAPYRVIVTVPDSRSLRLPVIRLALGAYFRVRLVSPAGEPIIAPQLRRRLFDVSGKPIFDGLSDRISDPADNDGAITIGPLPRGIMTVAVDMPLFAQTRLPDLSFSDATKTVDGGTIAIQQPGAVLHIDVLDGTGAPVPNHEVHIDDPRPRSPLVFRPVRTNQQGRATFDRLAAGQYRVSTTAADPGRVRRPGSGRRHPRRIPAGARRQRAQEPTRGWRDNYVDWERSACRSSGHGSGRSIARGCGDGGRNARGLGARVRAGPGATDRTTRRSPHHRAYACSTDPECTDSRDHNVRRAAAECGGRAHLREPGRSAARGGDGRKGRRHVLRRAVRIASADCQRRWIPDVDAAHRGRPYYRGRRHTVARVSRDRQRGVAGDGGSTTGSGGERRQRVNRQLSGQRIRSPRRIDWSPFAWPARPGSVRH